MAGADKIHGDNKNGILGRHSRAASDAIWALPSLPGFAPQLQRAGLR